MAIKKNQLYASLWASCDELRGGMDASLYKDYVLTLLFLKYVSDKHKQGGGMIELPAGTTFDDIVNLKNTADIGDRLNKIIAQISEANDLKGVIDVADFNDEDKLGKGKEMIDRLSKLVGIFEKLNLSSNQAEDDDLLGDAYEYLMRHFATESGKSKGQFYTPAEVSRIMAKIIGISADCPSSTSVYDPACGSGSLLLKAAAQANNQISLYGQEKDVVTASLARMNMILHNNETAEINTGNTLSDPSFRDENGGLKTFDFAVANPPFSSKNWTSGITPDDDLFERFSYGIPPEKNGDYAFLLHLLKSLKPSGKGAIILPHGVLFRGNAEARIRTELLNLGLIKGIIGLPANLFYGTGIPACIIVIDKEHAQTAQFAEDGTNQVISGGSVFMIDASRGFIKDGNKNRLREQDIHKIIDTFTKQEEIPHYSRMVHLSEIVAQDYNLNLPRYIDSGEVEDLQDLAAHLYGGIPAHDMNALEAYWQVLGRLKNELFSEHDGRFTTKIESSQIKAHILAHPDYAAFKAEHLAKFAAWHTQNNLAAIQPGSRPSKLIQQWSESLLDAFKPSSLIEDYDFYQILMDYWAETLQDDVYLIAQDGWLAAKDLKEITKESNEAANLTVVLEKTETDKKGKDKIKRIIKKYRSELLPPGLVAKRYFAQDLVYIAGLQSELDSISQELENLLEEHGNDDGVLKDVGSKKENETVLREYQELAWRNYAPDQYKQLIKLKKELADLEVKHDEQLKNPIFNDLLNKHGKITQKAIKESISKSAGDKILLTNLMELIKNISRLGKEIKQEIESFNKTLEMLIDKGKNFEYREDITIVLKYIDLQEKQSLAKNKIKTAQETLDLAVFKQFAQLTEDEIQNLTVKDKWLATLQSRIENRLENSIQQLISRLNTLEARYRSPMAELAQEVEIWQRKVDAHLKNMGFGG